MEGCSLSADPKARVIVPLRRNMHMKITKKGDAVYLRMVRFMAYEVIIECQDVGGIEELEKALQAAKRLMQK